MTPPTDESLPWENHVPAEVHSEATDPTWGGEMPNRDLPLNRRTITQGSILILPGYPAVMIGVGLIFLLQASSRTSGPGFTVARWILGFTGEPIHTWGWIFLALGLLELTALLTQQRSWFMWLLVVGCGLTGCWAFLVLASAWQDSLVSFTGAAWIGLGAYAHIASVRSLARDLVMGQ